MRILSLLAAVVLAACSSAEGETAAGGWSELAAAPIEGRTAHRAVWTGRAMIVFGGEGRQGALGDGAAYDGTTWTMLPKSPLVPRRFPAMVWTGREVVIHGGIDRGPLGDGASYDPSTQTWTPLPAAPLSPRTLPAFAFAPTTDELVIHGGNDGISTPAPARGARSSRAPSAPGRITAPCGPATRSSSSAAWTPTARSRAMPPRNDPAKDSWTLLDTPIAPRAEVTAVATEHGAALFGGQAVAGDDGCPAALADGATFDPSTRALHKIPNATTGARAEPAAWSGRGQLFVLGGYRCDEILSDGAMFDGQSWRPLPRFPLTARFGATAVWTGDRAIVWGGAAANGVRLNDGASYKPHS